VRISVRREPLSEPDTASSEEQKRRDGILVLAAIATMGLAAGDSSLAQVFINSLDRLAISWLRQSTQ
jgi:hypothetical protein